MIYNHFDRILMRENDTLTGNLLNLNKAVLKFKRELDKHFLIVFIRKILNKYGKDTINI